MSYFTNWRVYVIVALLLCRATLGVKVTVDFSSTLNTNGKRDFSRQRFVNAHGDFKAPKNAIHLMEYLVEELGVHFGRSNDGPISEKIFPYNVKKVVEEGAKNVESVVCDRGCDELRKRMITRERVVVDVADKIKLVHNSEEKIELGASFAADYFQYFFDESKGLPKPRYAECFNEPMVKWKSLRRNNQETEESVVRRVGNICGRFCSAITETNPEVMAGGPSASNGTPHLRNFDMFRIRQRAYLESAKEAGCVNFLSEHIYNSGGAIQDANLDLMETYTYQTSGRKREVLPYMVTEAGAYHKTWYNDTNGVYSAPPRGGRDFKILSDAFGGLMSSLRTHDNLLKYVNFLTLDPISRQASGEHRYPWSLTEGYGHDAKVKWTPLIDYFELLKGVQGEFTYSYSDDAFVKVHAVADAFKGYVLLQNFATSGSTTVELKFPRGTPKVEEVVYRKLSLDERTLYPADKAQGLTRAGKLRWSNETLEAVPKSIEMMAGDMTVLEFKMTKMVIERGAVERTRHYSYRVASLGEKIEEIPFAIQAGKSYDVYFRRIPTGVNGMAYVRISHSRKPHLVEKPTVWINDEIVTEYSAKMGSPMRDYGDKYFGTFVIPYPLEKLTAVSKPKVTLQYPDEGGWISTVVLEIDQCDGRSCCLLGGRDENIKCSSGIANVLARRRDVPSGEQIIVNPEFDRREGASAWKPYGGTRNVYSPVLLYGDRALQLKNEGAGVTQTVYLREGSMYRLHCFLRGRINMIIESGQTFYAAKNGNSQPVPNTVWRSTELDFRIEKAGFYTVRLERDDNGEPTVQDNGVFLHLCTIHRSDNVPRSIGTDGFKPPRERTLWTPPPRPSGGSEKFINPSFEEATSANKFGWTIEQSHRFRADMPLHDHRALELESGSIVTQKVKLVKGVDYNFRCYLTEEGSLGLSVVRLDTLVAENNDEHVQSIGYGNWGYKQVTFKAIGTQHNFTAVANGATPTIIDYCTLYKAI